MIVRVITPGPQETWYYYVVSAKSDGDYLSLRLKDHPSLVHHWLGAGDTSVLLCETSHEVTEALREEQYEALYHEMDKMRRI